MKVSFIGFGNMANALAKGLLRHDRYTIYASAPSLIQERNVVGIFTSPDNLSVIQNADIIILAVKPAMISQVWTEISDQLPKNALVISIATGIKLAWFRAHSPNQSLIRAMPNIAASVKESATPLIANDKATEKEKEIAEHIFKTVGITTWVNQEEDIDSYTAFSGSGPAYALLLIEAMIAAAVDFGISEDIAKRFALQTVQGALSVATKSELPLATLRNMITSPNGTTAAALQVFEEHEFEQLVHTAMKAARDRARQLGNEVV